MQNTQIYANIHLFLPEPNLVHQSTAPLFNSSEEENTQRPTSK